MDQNHLRFVPQVLAVTPGSTVVFINSDPSLHNVFSPSRRGAGFDLGIYSPVETRLFTFRDPGEYVILCHIHPEMVAWVVVTDSPYYGLSDIHGEFRIPVLPQGSYRLRAWHRKAGDIDRSIDVPRGGIRGLAVRLGEAANIRVSGAE